MSDDERPWTPPRKTEPTAYASALSVKKAPLPQVSTSFLHNTSSPVTSAWKHFALFLSLASGITDDLIKEENPAFTNFLKNMRDHDQGLFSGATEYIGRGLTFAVRRSTMPEHRPVVFKSSILDKGDQRQDEETQRLSSVLLELRVLTHPPLRAHPNIVTLFQVGWEGDASSEFKKWPVLVVEYAERGTLEDFFDYEPSIPFAMKRLICQDVTNGLLALHECQVVHGDLKLLNVLVFAGYESRGLIAKLSDFGGSLLDTAETPLPQIGTPPWNAPEWNTQRSIEMLLKSDIYSLGLLIWRVMLNGENPFEDTELFRLPGGKNSIQERREALEAEKLDDQIFLQKAKRSISEQAGVECNMLFQIFDVSIRLPPDLRDLDAIGDVLGCAERLSELTMKSDVVIEDTTWIRQKDPIFPLEGLVFTPVTASIRPRIYQALEETLQDASVETRMNAEIALAISNLAYEDFGGTPDIINGLNHLIQAAELGSREYKSYVLRLHETFGVELPAEVKPKIGSWLLEAAATGSMTAMEDLKLYGYENELKTAMQLLRTRYCGTGEETFDYDETASQALLSPSSGICRDYLAEEFRQMQELERDWSGYLLRLAATYGSLHGVNILIEEFNVGIDTPNDIGETPLYYATRSGHRDVTLRLLSYGANPRLVNERGETPLHWICSYDDEDVPEILAALIMAGASINAQAEAYLDEYEYPETFYVAGTPLHRAIARNKEAAVSHLLRIGVDPFAPTLDDIDETPIVLAARLKYCNILKLFQVSSDKLLLTSSGESLLIHAMSSGGIYNGTIGRLVRHGPKFKSRASETLGYLLERGATAHLPKLPGRPECTAVFYASLCQVEILDFLLRNGGKQEIDKPAELEHDPDENMTRPPLFQAVIHGKTENIKCLIRHGANVRAIENIDKPTTILYCCAEMGFQDLSIVDQFLEGGVGVDEGPEGYETPFYCAVRNRCFLLAEHLRTKGANVNALATKGLMFRSLEPLSLLGALVNENSQSCLSCVRYLLRKRPGDQGVNLIVQPSRNYTVFHLLANLNGDQQDPDATRSLLDICGTYFQPTASDLNSQTFAWDETIVESAGGNTALHSAIIRSNYEVIRWLLVMNDVVDISIKNNFGFTAQDIATLQYTGFERRFEYRDIPQHPSKQLRIAQKRRAAIRTLIDKYAANEPSSVLERYTLDSTDIEYSNFEEQ